MKKVNKSKTLLHNSYKKNERKYSHISFTPLNHVLKRPEPDTEVKQVAISGLARKACVTPFIEGPNDNSLDQTRCMLTIALKTVFMIEIRFFKGGMHCVFFQYTFESKLKEIFRYNSHLWTLFHPHCPKCHIFASNLLN